MREPSATPTNPNTASEATSTLPTPSGLSRSYHRGHVATRSQFREHVNTLLLQQILAEPEWAERLTDADRRALSPLFWTHINPYGRFELDLNSRLELDLAARAATVPGPRTAPEAETARSAADGAAGSAS